MTELLKVGGTENAGVISSREIAILTGKQHKDVMRDIRNLLEQGVDVRNFAPTEYADNYNRIQPCFHLTKKGCLILASGYDALLREKIINRWEELENANKPCIPQTFAEALMLAAQQAQQIEEQQKQLTEASPKVEFYNAVTDSKDCIDMASAAKVLNMGVGRNKLFEILRNNKILMGNNSPFQKYVDAGYFKQIEVKFTKPNGDTCINIKTVVYQKGLDAIRRLLTKLQERQNKL